VLLSLNGVYFDPLALSGFMWGILLLAMDLSFFAEDRRSVAAGIWITLWFSVLARLSDRYVRLLNSS
jgi:hypothetical protein